MDINQYFEIIESEVKKAYEIAEKARKKGADPENKVDIPLAKNIFERVEGLVGALKPEVIGSGISKRLEELDQKYGSGDWRVALIIAEEVAKRKFCEFKDDVEAIETGIRVGLAYITMGVVSAPLEGFIEFKIKNRMDGGKYASCYFAGPIRAAGGTAAAITLLLADYLRRKFSLGAYDATKEEIERVKIETETYHSMIARLQYYPTDAELEFLMKNIPIEINGDPTSQREVLIHKELPRVETPKIRGGMCLVLCEGLAQKAPKILKNIEKWGEEFELSDWKFLKEYLELKIKLHTEQKDMKKEIQPNNIYIQEAVAGRPIFSYPMAKGGFRLRYGRSRLTGLAAAGIHPSTTHILGDFIATGAQLRIERPGKACAITPCTSIDGPVVKLWDESVVKIETEEDVHKCRNKVKEILFLGDLLFAYGEFARNNHVLVPSPYVEEWWIQELAKAAGNEFTLPNEKEPLKLAELSIKYNIPLHPKLIFFYADLNQQAVTHLFNSLKEAKIENEQKITILHNKEIKKILEDICAPHILSDKGIEIEGETAVGLLYAFGYLPDKKWPDIQLDETKTPLEMINTLSKVKIKNKSGIYIGARLGRPEKAKQRKMKGRPHILFPVSSTGGRMRSLNEIIELGYVESEFPSFKCKKCEALNIYPKCDICGGETEILKFCAKCKTETDKEKHCSVKTVWHTKQKIDVRDRINKVLNRLNVSLPALVKGVRGTSNRTRIPEPLEKGVLRAMHGVYVNKDGTIRYDAIEAPITHFKPKEIGTSVDKLKTMGYEKDIYGNELKNDEQVLEIFPQDVILPDCKEWPDASALDMIFRTTSFVDDLLVRYYGIEPYYNIRTPKDMVGQIIIGLAPHTSAGLVGRIIGFSKTQCFFAHPYYHSACRRNCDGDEIGFMLLMDALLNFSRQYLPDARGSRHMDAPLVLTTRLIPKEVDDEVYNMDICDMYPIEFYEATEQWKSPYDVKIKQVKSTLGKPEEYRGMLYTHPTDSANYGNRISSYKTLVTVFDKVNKQMELAEKIKAVNKSDVAKIVIEKHFLKDIKGNLRRYSSQEFRCISCNEKYRRVPLAGKCNKCEGKLVLTVAEGTVSKYLEPSLGLVEKYELPGYLKQTLEILKRRVESLFGKDPTKQTGLKKFFG
ncbi:MAG: DNA polymerase II large subunit [Candidatus Omnitrophica bacterium]|nr:DNA polymerase II large subunit [Candidatus Omnitrophota bacterium]